MIKIDAAARSSMWEDLERRRPTEIDYLNGEILRLSARTGVAAPVNRAIVEMIRDAERAKSGSPCIDAAALFARVTR
jgi:2-dehydropantoate 2-reductase